MSKTTCLNCKQLFSPVRKTTTWCSRKCYLALYTLKNKPQPPKIVCARCPEMFISIKGAKYCSDKCKTPQPIQRYLECPQCGESFTTERSYQKFCARSCTNRYFKVGHLIESGEAPQHKPGDWTQETVYEKNMAKPNERVCDVEGCGRKHLARGYCHAHYKRYQIQQGNLNYGISGGKNEKTRAEYWNVAYEPINRTELYSRDSFTCQICQEALDMEAVFPAPLSPSLDHIIPISKGGPHTMDNAQSAHLLCNMRKKDKVQEAIECAKN